MAEKEALKPRFSIVPSKKQKHEEQKGSTDHLDVEYEKLLQTDPMKGLSDAEILDRATRFGPNGMLSLSTRRLPCLYLITYSFSA